MNYLILEAALSFFKRYWGQAAAVMAVLFMGLWSRSCVQSNALNLELEACNSKPPVIQTVQAKAIQTVRVVYKDGAPCPDMETVNDSSVSVTQTAQGDAKKCPQEPQYAVYLGGGYLVAPYAVAGARIGKLGLYGQAGIGTYGGGATWDLWRW